MTPTNDNLTFSGPRHDSGDFSGFSRLAYGAIAVVFGGFGLWTVIAPLDSAAVAHGRVSVEGDRKPVQHLEGGIVSEILVKEAQIVEEGDVLFRLQPTQAQANSELLRKQIDQAGALEARLVAEAEGKSTIVFPEALLQRRSITETATAIRDQERQFAERKRSRDMQTAILRTRLEQTGREIAGREKKARSLEAQNASYSREIAAVSSLAERGYYPRNKLMAMQREQSRTEGELGSTQADIAKLQEVLQETRLQINQIEQKTLEEVSQQLSEVRARLSEATEKLSVAQDVLFRIDVRSPRRGVVLGVKVNSAGTVVTPGAILAEVVPMSDKLQLSARVSPLDVQAVAVGQTATIRFPGLSSRLVPTIFGRVETLSADSVTDETTKETYFSAKIVIDRKLVSEDIARMITPGMPADVLISTGERTAFDYLVGPLRDTVAKAMRER